MKYLLVTVYCSLLTSGNLQAPNNINDHRPSASTSESKAESNDILPLQSYQSPQGGFYGAASHFNRKPCPRYDNLPYVPLKPRGENGEKSLPTRRSYTSRIGFNDYNSPQGYQPSPEFNIANVKSQDATTKQNVLELQPQIPIDESYEWQSVDNEDNEKQTPDIGDHNYVIVELNDPLETNNSDEDSIEINKATTLVLETIEPVNDYDEATTDLKSTQSFEPAIRSTALSQVNEDCRNKKTSDFVASRRSLTSSDNNQPNAQINTQERNEIKKQERRVEENNSDLKTIQDFMNLNEDHINKLLKPSNIKAEEGAEKATDRRLNDPTVGQGISPLKKSMPSLMEHDRICYACSTSNNPTCSSPDRKTTVKYCRKGTKGCVTKVFGNGGTLTLIRDCGKSCDDSGVPGLAPKYKSCSICHSDLCNGAYSINVHSLMLSLPTLVLIVVLKSTF